MTDKADYERFLKKRLNGLNSQELRDLCNILIDRVRGLEEPSVILSAESKNNIHNFAKIVNNHLDKMPVPTPQEFDYFYAKALHISYDLNDYQQMSSIIWSWFQEHEKRGHFNDEQKKRYLALQWEMYLNDGIKTLAEFTDRPPEEEYEEAQYAKLPKDDTPLELWREYMDF